jgi:ATP synthase F1 gamma subunit
MKRPLEILPELNAMGTMVNLTSVFEGIASMRIAQIKNQVIASQQFFGKLWEIYSQIRVDSVFRYGRNEGAEKVSTKELLIAITGEGGFSGDIDQKLIELLVKNYDKDKHEIVVIGHHGAIQLVHQGVAFKRYFKMPERDKNINVQPIIREVQKYSGATVYYQTYVSLGVQDVARISLNSAVVEQGNKIKSTHEVISEENYIFEPSTFAVVDHLERSMMQIALTQTILESKLAQYASRFKAMSAAKKRANESSDDLRMLYNRAKRSLKDERLKEIMNGLRYAEAKL